MSTEVSTLILTTIIGLAFSSILYGISILQTFFYFHNYKSDGVSAKLVVLLLWVLDTLGTAMVVHSLHTTLSIHHRQGVPALMTWSITLEAQITDIITFISHSFFSHQIYRMMRSRAVPMLIMFLSFFGLGADTYLVAEMFKDPRVDSLARPFMVITGCVIIGVYVLCDILIATVLTGYFRLWRRGSDVAWTLETIDKLVTYVVGRGTLTALCQFTFLMLYVMYPHRTYYIPFHLIVSKLYVNSVLASLNARQSLRKSPEEIQAEDTAIVFARREETSGSTVVIEMVTPKAQEPSGDSVQSGSTGSSGASSTTRVGDAQV